MYKKRRTILSLVKSEVYGILVVYEYRKLGGQTQTNRTEGPRSELSGFFFKKNKK
jgi:hypothetical protein